MDSTKKVAVELVLTSDPELFPPVQGVLACLAEPMGFEERERQRLRQGVRQACQQGIEEITSERIEEIRLHLAGFPDRPEVELQGGARQAGFSDGDALLLNQLVDKVVFEEVGEGRLSLIPVKNLSNVGRQP